MGTARLTPEQIEAAGLVDWRSFGHSLQTRFRTGNFVTGLRLVNLIGEAAEEAGHHPDLDLRYPLLNVRLYSHDAFGITDRDVALARRISELAAGLGVPADPSTVSVVEIALDSPDYRRVKPFWRAVLGYRDNPDADDEVRNDDGALPPLWFQESSADEPRQRFHLDIRVPSEVARERIDAAVAAGGRVVGEEPTFTILEDVEGNKACICTGP
jgi:4a-hydroxytetrahydrobiopterin dehydratase